MLFWHPAAFLHHVHDISKASEVKRRPQGGYRDSACTSALNVAHLLMSNHNKLILPSHLQLNDCNAFFYAQNSFITCDVPEFSVWWPSILFFDIFSILFLFIYILSFCISIPRIIFWNFISVLISSRSCIPDQRWPGQKQITTLCVWACSEARRCRASLRVCRRTQELCHSESQ